MTLFRPFPLFLFSTLTLLTSFQVQAAPAPLEVYAALPGVSSARLSPDGKLLALIAPVKGLNTLVVWDLDGKEKSRTLPTGDFEPEWFVWKSNQRLIAGLRSYSMRLPMEPTIDTRLIALDADGNKGIPLVNADLFKTYIPQIQDKIVSLLPSDENHILMELPAIQRNLQFHTETSGTTQYGRLDSEIKYPEVVRVDVNTGHLETIAHQHGKVVSWNADAAGNVRLGREINGKQIDFQVRGLAEDSWHTIQSFEINKGRVFRPVAFVDGDPNRLYVLSNHDKGFTALYEFDVTTDTFIRTVAANPHGSVEALVKDGHLIGYRLFNNSSPVYLDAAYAREAKVINPALPDSRNDITDISTDGKRVLVMVTKGNEPPAFWLMDRSKGRPELTPVTETYPDLEPNQIAPTQLVSYKARDGLEIPALLTLPPGYIYGSGNAPLPFVVLPHGGPTAHDNAGFDYQVQFLATRGYGVLQPQFRGSTGHGAAFEVAGQRQWGLAMQDDVTDGTLWLVKQKLADPARIAILGTSYGGYSALMGAVKEPELYRCAVAIAPVTDLVLLRDRLAYFTFSDVNIPPIGTDSDVLEKTSPAHNAERIRIPLLLVHGRKDYTVPVAHTEKMDEALRKAGKHAEVLYLDEADHYLSRANDRLATLKALEKFLATNLSAR